MSMNRLDRWIGRNQLNPNEMDGNRFLKAADLFGETAIQLSIAPLLSPERSTENGKSPLARGTRRFRKPS